jgi:TatD DNase family protein
MLIDTHCHLDFDQFDPDREEVIKRAFSQNVDYIINVGSDLRGSQACVELVKKHKNIYGSVGIHPHHAEETTKEDIAAIERLSYEQKIIAIGEVGLDYFDRQSADGLIEKSKRKIQQEILTAFIQTALSRDLPLIFHCRNAAEDLLPIISEFLKKENKAVIHCFSQSRQVLKACLDQGIYVSFTGNITYKNADPLRELIKYCPLDRMFLETDAPYLAPQKKRGTRNEPAYVNFIAEVVADIKGTSVGQVAEITSKSAKKFFNIN